jgi:hypothetical protein
MSKNVMLWCKCVLGGWQLLTELLARRKSCVISICIMVFAAAVADLAVVRQKGGAELVTLPASQLCLPEQQTIPCAAAINASPSSCYTGCYKGCY